MCHARHQGLANIGFVTHTELLDKIIRVQVSPLKSYIYQNEYTAVEYIGDEKNRDDYTEPPYSPHSEVVL